MDDYYDLCGMGVLIVLLAAPAWFVISLFLGWLCKKCGMDGKQK